MAYGRLGGMVIGFAAATLVAAGAASAQPGQPAPDPSPSIHHVDQGPRSGFTVGAAIGRGNIDVSCSACDNIKPITEGLSISFYGGYMLTPRLSLLGEYWSVRYSGRGSDWFPDSRDHYVAQHMLLAGIQLWLHSHVYIRASLGTGWHHSDGFYTHLGQTNPNQPVPAAAGSSQPMTSTPSRYSPAASIGIGVEFAHTRTFACDIMLRAGSTRRPADQYQVHNVALTFGAAWF